MGGRGQTVLGTKNWEGEKKIGRGKKGEREGKRGKERKEREGKGE